MNFRKRAYLFTLCAIGVSLNGCASLNGAPEPIIPVSNSVKLAQGHDIEKAIRNIHSANAADRLNLGKQQYRDMVVAVYLNAIDARYQEFRGLLSGEGRGGAIGADLGIIGLTTAASLVEKSAGDLSAIAAAVAGGKGTVDKNLYFERTLPAILAAMDAERAKVRKHIVTSMRKNESEYPLEVAFGDLAAYESSASIDRAIDAITSSAAASRAIETVELEKVIKTCAKPEDLRSGHASISRLISELETKNDLASLEALAAMTETDTTGATGLPQGNAIREKLRSHPCTAAELDGLIASIDATTWGANIR